MYKGDFGAEDNAGDNDQYIQSVVFEQKFLEKWAYIFQSDYGFVRNGALEEEMPISTASST